MFFCVKSLRAWSRRNGLGIFWDHTQAEAQCATQVGLNFSSKRWEAGKGRRNLEFFPHLGKNALKHTADPNSCERQGLLDLSPFCWRCQLHARLVYKPVYKSAHYYKPIFIGESFAVGMMGMDEEWRRQCLHGLSNLRWWTERSLAG